MNTVPGVHLDVVSSEYVCNRVSEYKDVYAAALGMPPFNEGGNEAELFGAELTGELSAEGFVSVEARAESTLTGFCYGYVGPVASDHGWMGTVTAAVAADKRVFIDQQWAVGWLAVRPEWQGWGLGSRLFDRLMGHCATAHAWLVTWCDETLPAARMYTSRGWEILGTGPLGWYKSPRSVMGFTYCKDRSCPGNEGVRNSMDQ